MYKHNLKVCGEYLIKNSALPQNASQEGSNVVRAGGGICGLEIVCAANGAATLTAGKNVSISALQSMDGDTFIALPVAGQQSISADKTSFEDGEIMARLPLPSEAMPYIKASLTTDDAAATGNFDLFLAYLAR